MGIIRTWLNDHEFIDRPDPLKNIWVMKITADRRIEVNEDVDVTEAAKKVLECMQTMLTKRTWVGLTDEDISELRLKTLDAVATNYEVYQAIEAKLQQKNT